MVSYPRVKPPKISIGLSSNPHLTHTPPIWGSSFDSGNEVDDEMASKYGGCPRIYWKRHRVVLQLGLGRGAKHSSPLKPNILCIVQKSLGDALEWHITYFCIKCHHVVIMSYQLQNCSLKESDQPYIYIYIYIKRFIAPSVYTKCTR